MCGIVGYIGSQDALPVIISGLEKLEYRGYDSAGVAVLGADGVQVVRAMGKLSELKKVLAELPSPIHSKIGIGHTRWATHGRPSENNAHPHTAGRVSLIHNGIIENYAQLKEELRAKGATFSSDTDTEVAAKLCDQFLEQGMEPFAALKATCARLRGSYAFLMLDSKNPDRIIVAKNATPIVIGMGEGEVVIASDIPAILSVTRDVVILEDGDFAEVSVDALRIETSAGPVTRKSERILWDPVTAQKGGFKHFMLKEIHEQGRVAADTLRGRVDSLKGQVALGELDSILEQAPEISRILMLGCGTAWHACLLGKYFIESNAGVPTEVDYAHEFRYRGANGRSAKAKPLLDSNTVSIAVSQSGETADTIAAIELAKTASKVMAVCNVLGSSLTRRVDATLYTHAGPEISVASTKAFTTQLISLYLFALALAQGRKALSAEQLSVRLEELVRLPGALDETIKVSDAVHSVAREFHSAKDFLFLGRGPCFPVALEGALKLKEISYIHAEGYPAGEMKHGPIALIDEQMPVVIVLQRSDVLYEKSISNLREVDSRGGRIIAVTDVERDPELDKLAAAVIRVPFLSEELSPILLTVPLQLLAYHIAVLNGTDVDLPRNLAKSVTVE